MTAIADILTPSRTLVGGAGTSKKRALEHVAEFIHQDMPSLEAGVLCKSRINREKLGSTGIGRGIAIPHCRMKLCHHITGALVRLSEPVDFDAMDDQAVDLMFVLLVPEEAREEHLQVLGRLAELFNDDDFRAALRAAEDSQALYERAVAFDRARERQRQNLG